MVIVKKYTPNQGDIIWIDFEPQKGREINKRRPALVLSGYEYNKNGLALLCPITTTIKNYPFEVVVKTKNIDGAILADQIKSFDLKERNAELACKVSKIDFLAVLKIIAIIIKPE